MSFVKLVESNGLLSALFTEWSKFTAPSSAGTPSMLHQVVTLTTEIASVGTGALTLASTGALALPAGAVLVVSGIVSFLHNVGDYLSKYDTPAVQATAQQKATGDTSISQAHNNNA